MGGRDLVAQLDRVQLESETLYDLIGAIASSPDLDRVLAGVVAVLTKATRCHACFIYLRRGDRLAMRAASRIYAHVVGQVEFSVQEGLAGWAVRHNRPAFIRENALCDPRTIYIAELEEERFQSMAAVPVPARNGAVMGAIVLHTIAPYEFDEAGLNLLSHAATLVAGVIENAQLYDDARRRVASLTALSALSQRIAAVTDRAGLYRAATEGVRALLDCEEARLYELDADRNELQIVAADPDDALSASAPRVRNDAILLELLHGRSHVKDSVQRVRETFALSPSAAHVFAVPVAAGEERLGVLVAAGTVATPEEAEELLRAVANQIAVALKKAELIEHLTAESIVHDLFEALEREDFGLAATRAEQARSDLARPHVVIECRQMGDEGAEPAGFASRLEAGIRRAAPGALCDIGSRRVRALLPLSAGGAHELARLDRALADLGAGAGAAIGRSDVRRGVEAAVGGIREAADAAGVARVLARGGGTFAYAELGVYRYLVRVLGDDAPRDPYLDAVRVLVDYDRRRGSQLVLTLERYLADRRGIAETARALMVHPNTLRQRLERIETLIGIDLANADLLSFELALKLARLEPTQL